MAKDPAFLFYPNDWLGGTMGLTRHQKGCYIDLLVAQFNRGPLSLETIKTVLGQDQATWTILSSKFKQDAEGCFYNERLATEVVKRRQFSQSRRDNAKKRYDKPASADASAEHKHEHMENANRDISILYTIEHCLEVAMKDDRFVRANKATELHLKEFNKVLEKQGVYHKNPWDYKTHYANWIKNAKIEIKPDRYAGANEIIKNTTPGS
jgi:hypothetical protein